MKKKKGIIKSKKKLTGFIVASLLVLVTAFGFLMPNNFKSILTNVRNVFAAHDVPEHSKTIESNGDGTHKLSLTVTGDADTEVETAANVNVLIVYDTSSSMTSNNVTTRPNRNRADYAEDVVHDFIDGLKQYQNTSDPSNIQVAVVTFGPSSSLSGDNYPHQSWTSNLTSTGNNAANRFFDDEVDGTVTTSNNYSSHNGTNWEAALQQAQTYLNSADSDPTFVILVTDGACTASGNGNNAINPAGNRPWTDFRSFYVAATDEARTIQSRANTTLFGIYAYGTEADLLDDLIYYSNTGNHRVVDGYSIQNATASQHNFGGTETTNNYYNANNTEALNSAIQSIFQTIVEALGVSSVTINDPTTSKVETSSGEISKLLEVDKNSFQYWLTIPVDSNNQFKRVNLGNGVEETYTVSCTESTGKCTVTWGSKSVEVDGSISGGKFKYEWTEANELYNKEPPEAEFKDGAVNWDLNSVGTLLNGVKYEVTFDVYPSQETYDLIADLKNGTKTYESLDENISRYLVKDGDSYSLKTNTEDENGNSTATITYTDTRTDDGEQTILYTNPSPVATTTDTLKIEKEWAQDPAADTIVTMTLLRDGSSALSFDLDGKVQPLIDKWEYEAWKAKDIHISTGLSRTKSDGTLEILDEGHDYTFGELGAESFNWELEAKIYHPMIIDNVLYELILLEDEDTKPDMSGTNYKTVDGKTYVKLDEDKIYERTGNEPVIRATNYRRSNLNIKKNVTGENANPNDEFEYTIKVTQKDEDDKVIVDNPDTNDDDLWFSVQDKDGNWVDYGEKIGVWTRYVGTDRETGKTTYYYYAPNDNDTELKIKLKNKYNIRFTNIISNTDFSVVESDRENYSLEKIEATSGFEGETDEFTPNVDDKKATGHVGTVNTTYQIEYTNKNEVSETTKVKVTKIWDDGNDSAGFRPDVLTITIKDGDGNIVDTQTEPVRTEDGKWYYESKELPKYKNGKEATYSVEEAFDDSNEKYTLGTPEEKATNEFEITNSYEPENVKVKVTKIWDDGNDSAGFRPDELTITIKDGDGNTVDTQTVPVRTTEDGKWYYESKELPKYKDGEEVTYEVEETFDDPNEKYTLGTPEEKATNEFEITNSYTPETIKVEGTKTWKDNDNAYSTRPGSIEIILWKNNGKTRVDSQTVTPDDNGNWSYSFTGLPKYENGTEIGYSVTETPVSQYTTNQDGNNFINLLTGKVSVKGVKKWIDGNNQDNSRPKALLLVLIKNGQKTDQTYSVSESDNWSHTWEKLDEYDEDGVKIEYSVDEDSVPEGYEKGEVTYSEEEKAYVITNTHETEKTSIKVTKEWIDANNKFEKRPNSIKVTLKANGTAKETVEIGLDEDGNPLEGTTVINDNSWSYTWSDLDKNAGGSEINYTVSEAEVSGYATSDPEKTDEGWIIYNTLKDQTKDIKVTKVWEDDSNRDNLRPKNGLEVTITGRVGDEVVVGPKPITLTNNGTNTWTGTFEQLPVFKDGKLVSYIVDEDLPEGYEQIDYTGSEDTGFTITNEHIPTEIKISGTKKWEDHNDVDGLQPTEITLTLIVNEKELKTITVEVGEDGTWSFNFDDLKLYKNENGQPIKYEIKEKTVDGYETTITDVTTDESITYTVLNTHTPKISYKVTKSWNDLGNNDGIRPDSITVRLLANGTEVDSQVISEANEWTYTFVDLDRFDSDGNLIKYTIIEDEVEGYETSIDAGEITETTQEVSATVTNKHEPEIREDIKVTKTWVDDNNKYGVRPEEITIRLLANDKEVKVAKLTAANGWTFTFTGLLKYKDGVEIIYTITEDAVLNYDSEIDGFNVTNTYNGPHGEIVPPNTMVSANGVNKENFSVLFFLILGLIGLVFRKEANN